MRSSYSMPSRFIAATASPRARNCCCESTGRGSSRVASMTLTHVERVVAGARGIAGRRPGSSSPNAASANGDSGWLSAKFGCRSTVSRMRAVAGRTRGARAARRPPAAATSVRKIPSARRASSYCRARDSWLSKTSERTFANTSPPRAMTLMSIAAVSCRCGSSGSGSAATSRSNARLAPVDEALRRLLAHDLARASSGRRPPSRPPRRSRSRAPGAITTTVPAVS